MIINIPPTFANPGRVKIKNWKIEFRQFEILRSLKTCKIFKVPSIPRPELNYTSAPEAFKISPSSCKPIIMKSKTLWLCLKYIFPKAIIFIKASRLKIMVKIRYPAKKKSDNSCGYLINYIMKRMAFNNCIINRVV